MCVFQTKTAVRSHLLFVVHNEVFYPEGLTLTLCNGWVAGYVRASLFIWLGLRCPVTRSFLCYQIFSFIEICCKWILGNA